MPKYQVELTDGRKFVVDVDGNQPPTEDEILAQLGETPRNPLRSVPETLQRVPPMPAPPPESHLEQSPMRRLVGNFAEAVLPSTTLSDYWEGPAYAARHPIDSLSLLFGAMRDAHADQASKTKEAAGRVLTSPTIGGRVGAASETVGHGLATVLPFVGPAAAQRGEQIASGDIAGGVGGGLGLLAPFGVAPAVEASAPVRSAVANRMRASNVQQMERALAATTNENKTRAARVAPKMLERRIWNRDLEKLEARAASESNKAGKAVGDELATVANKETDVLPLIDELEKAKEPYIDTAAGGNRVVIDEAPVEAIQKLQDTLMEYGDRISIRSLNKVRMAWDDTVQAGKGFTTTDLGTKWKTWAAREGRTVLREELGKASPDVDLVMAEFSFWQNIEDVAHATNRRRVGQAGNLTPTIAGGAAAIVTEAVMPGSGMAAKVGAAAIGAKLGASLRRLLNSPGYQMFSAVQKQRLADALSSGNKDRIATAVARGLEAAAGAPRQGERTSIVGVTR